ncbi:MAG TPA: glutathione peroxidase [Kofleriaceae bacterium]|nr:glutathione peroxidase [Kofleriaceae bacterium]
MNKLALAAAVLGLAACSKSEPAATSPKDPAPATASAAPAATDPAPTVVKGSQAAASDPANLPAPGPAPTPVAIDNLDPIWNTPIKTLQGKPTTLAAYKGKALMIVNVASKCGNTPQYSTLEALQKKYESKGFTVIGFPSNQFMNQEPGTAEEIQTFCATNYGITFPMMEKIEVNGDGANPIYKKLTPIADVNGKSGDIRWNFEKFVVSADGKHVTRFAPKVKPEDPSVIGAVEAALPAGK